MKFPSIALIAFATSGADARRLLPSTTTPNEHLVRTPSDKYISKAIRTLIQGAPISQDWVRNFRDEAETARTLIQGSIYQSAAQITQKIKIDEIKAFVMEAAKTSGVTEAQVKTAIGESNSNLSPSAKKIMEPAVQSKIHLELNRIRVAALTKAKHIDSHLQGFDAAEKKSISVLAIDMQSAFDIVAADLTGLSTEAVHSAMQGLTISGGKLVAITGSSKAAETETAKKLQSQLPAILTKLGSIQKESRAAATSALSSKVELANALRDSDSEKAEEPKKAAEKKAEDVQKTVEKKVGEVTGAKKPTTRRLRGFNYL